MTEGLRANIAKARALARDGCHDHAARAYGVAAGIARRFELPGETAFCLRNAAQCWLEGGSAQAALPPAQESLDIYGVIDPARGANYVQSARLVAVIKDALGKPGEAHNLWAELREIHGIYGAEASVEECEIRLST